MKYEFDIADLISGAKFIVVPGQDSSLTGVTSGVTSVDGVSVLFEKLYSDNTYTCRRCIDGEVVSIMPGTKVNWILAP